MKAEIDELREEIRSLVLDRVWALRKEGDIAVEVDLSENNEPQSSSRLPKGDPEHQRAILHKNSSRVNEEPCQEIVSYSLNSLNTLDAALSENNLHDSTISARTFSRSDNAVDYLINRWTVMVISESPHRARVGQQFVPDTTKCTYEDEKDGHYSSSASDVLKLDAKNNVEDRHPENGLGLKLLPQDWIETATRKLPPEISNLPFSGVDWNLNSHEFPRIVATEDAFCWLISVKPYLVHLIGKHFVAYTKQKEYFTADLTYLPFTWFEPYVLRRKGYQFKLATIPWNNQLLAQRSPIESTKTVKYVICIPKVLNLVSLVIKTLMSSLGY